ncbi:MAG TPA: cation diffusion facilitator family transporter [Acidobacteriota bacterium]|nr:cation diffusion facilitator family transporter [Acidobacteriota bacterium]HQM64068.1 cation diffusion facilitator family transporter [Acidobacteriota bacterium]
MGMQPGGVTRVESTDPQRQAANREKRLVALSSVLAAVFLTGIKLGVGLWTNSLGILSEAAHSGLDLVAAAVTLWAVRVSGHPADRDHTYGHGKVENLSALFETLLLLLTCTWIIYEAFRRLFSPEPVVVDASIWAFLVVIVSIVVDVSRSRALRRVAEKHGSQALEADALHFSTDIYSSLVVLVGLAGVRAAAAFHLPVLEKMDALAALGVAVIVVWVSIQLGLRSVRDLLDAVPRDLPERMAGLIRSVPGVARVTQLRVRRSGPDLFADVTVAAAPGLPLERVHAIADAVETAIRDAHPRADVVVHVEPDAAGTEGLVAAVRLQAARLGLAAHAVRFYERDARRSVELHLEVDEGLSLDEAHGQADRFEQALRRELPEIADVVTHLEPVGDGSAACRAEAIPAGRIHDAIAEFLAGEAIAAQPHDLQVQRLAEGLSISLHCALDPGTGIRDAHDLTERMERFLKARVPGVARVVVHTEPRDA